MISINKRTRYQSYRAVLLQINLICDYLLFVFFITLRFISSKIVDESERVWKHFLLIF